MKLLKSRWCGLLVCFGIALQCAVVWAGTPAEKVLTFRLLGEPETLDWNRAHTPFETYLMTHLMDGLLSLDNRLKITPALAQSWKISPDGKTYVFNLRRDVKWSDGVPLKAQDFVYSWKRLLTPSTAAAYAYFLYDVVGAEDFNQGRNQDFNKVGVKARDEWTLEVKLKHPMAQWIHIPTFWVTYPMREDLVSRHGTGWTQVGKMVTLGPYLLKEHVFETKVHLKKNPSYYGSIGNVEEIVGQVIKDDATALNLYESGKLDFLTDISTTDLKRLEGRPDLKIFPYLKTAYLGLVGDRGPLANSVMRRAIAMSIDKTQIGTLLFGGQKPATSWVPPSMMGHSETLGIPYNPQEGRKLMKTAVKDLAQPVVLDLAVLNWDKALTLAQFIQGELKKNLGIEVVLQPYDHKTFRAKTGMRAHPLYLTSWSADFPDPDNFLSVFLGQSGNNRTGWKSTEFDHGVETARHSLKPEERKKAYLKLQRLLLEKEAVIVPLYYEPIQALVKPRVRNLELSPINYLNLKKVELH